MNRILNGAGWWLGVGGLCAALCGCATWTAGSENDPGPPPVAEAPDVTGAAAPPEAPVAPDPDPAEGSDEPGGVDADPETPAMPDDGLGALQRAWRAATPEEREEFRRWMMDAGE